MTLLFCNLLVNSVFSLFAGLLVVHLFLWLFRVGTGPGRLFLLSLPFAKIVYDCARGIPRNSILFTGIDTFSLPSRHHLLLAGAGVTRWGPTFSLQFSVDDLAGHRYAESVGDYAALWLNKAFGPAIPVALLSATLAVSAFLLARRLVQAARFERERRSDRAGAPSLRRVKLSGRNVDVYVSRHFSGTPFTGGIFRPYICLPTDACAALTAGELEAVIAHELGHVRQLDLAGTIAVQLLGDLFWFVPGYRWLSRRIDRLRELVADQWAVRSGIEPTLLASALLKLRELPPGGSFVPYSAFVREKSLLATRVRHLLGETPEPPPRLGWQNRWARAVVAVWILTAVMTATLGGNHRTDGITNPAWVDRLLERWGLSLR